MFEVQVAIGGGFSVTYEHDNLDAAIERCIPCIKHVQSFILRDESGFVLAAMECDAIGRLHSDPCNRYDSQHGDNRWIEKQLRATIEKSVKTLSFLQRLTS